MSGAFPIAGRNGRTGDLGLNGGFRKRLWAAKGDGATHSPSLLWQGAAGPRWRASLPGEVIPHA